MLCIPLPLSIVARPRRAVTPQEIHTIEPALQGKYYGGFYTPSDATGDIHKFTRGLADACRRKGAIFIHDASVRNIEAADGVLVLDQFDNVVLDGIDVGRRFWNDHQVTVLDRHRYPAMETSFANGGQLSASNAEVWNNPSTIFKGLRWMFKRDAPVLMNPSPSWHKYSWMGEFIGNVRNYRTGSPP